jgi:AraC-like DNA-binding protein
MAGLVECPASIVKSRKARGEQDMDRTTTSGTVHIAYARALLDHLRAAGTDPARLYPAKLLRELESEGAGQRVAAAQFHAMYDHAAAATRDAGLVLRVAAAIKPRHFGIFGYVTMTCASLLDVGDVLIRYEGLVDNLYRLRLQRRGERIELHWLPRSEAPGALSMKLSLASWIVYARQLCGRPELPSEAHFSCPAPADIGPYTRLFRGPVHFGRPLTRLVGTVQDWNSPVVNFDPVAHRGFVTRVEARLSEHSGEPELLRSLKSVLSANLAGNRLTLRHAAESLHLPPRTLQYRLEHLGLSFREALDQVRRSHAEQLLQNPRISLAEVAFLLGYSDQANFQHAFKRWLDQSPGEYRAQVLGGGAPARRKARAALGVAESTSRS